ncbi:DUF3149 domain-containing protein [Thalassotalea fusca]
MNIIDMLLNDPIVLYSFVGLGIVLGICGYYIYYFIKHIEESKS